MSDDHATDQPTSRLSPLWRRVLTVVLGALFVVCFALFTVGVVVRDDLLDPELYIQVLDETDVYDRIYTEILADPEMQEVFRSQVGINLDLVVEELYAQIVAAGAMVVPPSTLRAASESVIRDTVAYVRGDVPELDGTVRDPQSLDSEALSRKIVGGLSAAVSEELATDLEAEPAAEKDPDALDVGALEAYTADLADGRIRAAPGDVRSASVAQLTRDERAELVDVLLGPEADSTDEATRFQIEASLASDDLPSAVATASMTVLRPQVESAVEGLLDRVASSGVVDGISAAATALAETRASLIETLNTVRGYADLVQKAILPLALLMLGLMAAIVWLNSSDLRSTLASAGWVLVAAGVITTAMWLGARWWLSSSLASRFEASTGLTPGLENVLGDVIGALAGAVFGSIWSVVLFWTLAGAVALAFAYSGKLGAWLRRALEPVWPYRVWVLAGVFGLIVIVPLFAKAATASARAANPPCNGHPELCDRPINEVAFATSHNAMSITEYGWLWPMHDGTITDQLEAGVRALMIDTFYIDDTESQTRFFESLTPEEQDVARERVASLPAGKLVGALLCHGSCQLGSTVLGDTLDEISLFLEENPREVLFIIIQDEITSEDTETAFLNGGLVDRTYTPEPGQAMPTLGELIEADTRLVVMAENESPPPDWYPNAWDLTEETPYTFVFPEDFSCEPNRGGTDKPFFLLNHWIQRAAPNRVDAATVNEYDFLMGRAEQCAEERGKLPNFVAVNFYRQGDLMRVVDDLNGVGPETSGPETSSP